MLFKYLPERENKASNYKQAFYDTLINTIHTYDFIYFIIMFHLKKLFFQSDYEYLLS